MEHVGNHEQERTAVQDALLSEASGIMLHIKGQNLLMASFSPVTERMFDVIQNLVDITQMWDVDAHNVTHGMSRWNKWILHQN